MRRIMIKKLLFLVILISVIGCANTKIKTIQNTSSKDVKIIKPNLKSDKALKRDIVTFYKSWKEQYLKIVPNKNPEQIYLDYGVEARKDPDALSDWFDPANAVTTSESQGYAMIITASMANIDKNNINNYKEQFNALYRFFRAHPSRFSNDLMCWQEVGIGLEKKGDTVTGEVTDVKNIEEGADSAIDGDMDIAYSLLIADKIWGSNGEINYKEEALKVIKAIMKNEVNKKEHILLLGDWVLNSIKNGEIKENKKYLTITRSSDFILDHLRAFSNIDKENSKEWTNILEKTEAIINYNVNKWSKNTGLVADFLQKDENGNYTPAIGNVLEGDNDGDYNWNACRDPWRFSVDVIYNKSQKITSSIKILNNWVKKNSMEDPEKIYPGYYIRNGEVGKVIDDRNTWGEDLSFTAPFLVSGCVGENNQEWINKLWENIIDTKIGDSEYFGNAIKMQALIIASGNLVNVIGE
ncbi:glycosyl hydrolase family 8 [Haliovirga abyssi]|uniref:Licheninase n=1 Tax=Haliovirga abyssi TaxID=2996794 RepID=A0AAU9DE16_9FUSO|nr:glycosyl hydrolase family 8 [Haliovirga abyssi]BDU51595.1 licheninase [Haliovirga abyssi]